MNTYIVKFIKVPWHVDSVTLINTKTVEYTDTHQQHI